MGSKKFLISGILLLAALALISATQVWLTIDLAEGVAAQETLTVTGQQLSPPLAPLALALAALALALTIAGKIFRFVLGALGVLLGAGIVALTSGVLGAPLEAASGKVTELTGIGGSESTGIMVVAASHLSVWGPITAVAGLLAAILGVLVIIFGLRWRSGGRKYEVASAASSAAAQQTLDAETDGSTDSEAGRDRFSDWDSLSDGTDPSEDGSDRGFDDAPESGTSEQTR